LYYFVTKEPITNLFESVKSSLSDYYIYFQQWKKSWRNFRR